MYPISAACKAALLGSHTRTPVLEVYSGFGPLVASTYSNPRIQLDPDAGDDGIRVDRTAKHVRMLTATIVDVDGSLAPQINQPIIDPLRGPQIQAYFDIGWFDPPTGQAVVERIPAGRFLITRTTGTESGVGETIAIEGTSRSSKVVERNTWLAPYNVIPAVGYDQAIRAALIDRSYAGWIQQFRFEASAAVTPYGMVLGLDGSSDPWAELQQMAITDGRELLDDQLGGFLYRTPPSANGATSVWSYDESVSSPRLRNTVTRETDLDNAYNGVLLTGSAPWLTVPVSSVKWDEDPTSPTYFRGPFGQHPLSVDDVAVATQEQADAACIAKFNDVIGVTEQVGLEALPNPAHDPGDIVTVISSATGLADLAVLQAFTLPFDVEHSMPATIARRRSR